MSESAPEPRAPNPSRDSGGAKGLFTNKIGPLPMWVWLVILAVIIVGWAYFQNRKAAASTTAADSTSASDVPQFVNQTFVQTSPPAQAPPPTTTPKPGTPVKIGTSQEQTTRNWTSEGGSTLAQVSQRLLGNTDVANLHPANAAADKWLKNVYSKNHNAKMPKGLQFTYTEGTVTAKT